MNKRAFLKLISAAMSMPGISPLLAWAGGEKLKNWAGNVEYGTDRLYSATSVEPSSGICQKARAAESARHAPLLQSHRGQHG